MNAQKLSRLNAQNRAAQIFFAACAERTRSLPQTTVQDVIDIARRNDITVSPAEVEAFFEGLTDAAVGQFVCDEGTPYFRWVFKSTQVSRAALRAALPQTAAAPALQTPPLVHHTWRGRADWTLQLDLPPDFSAAEARRLCNFVLSLPLSDPQDDKATL